MGVVYSGVDLVSGSTVAVKVLAAATYLGERGLQRFIDEASAAAAIAHPAVVAIRHVDVAAGGVPFLVMELVNGVTLDALAARGRFRAAWAVSIGHVVADALAAAHRANVIHRDIKPANLMVCRRVPGVRVLDFGISKLRPAPDRVTLTQTGSFLGTPAYMAPEQIEDAARVTAASDVYSLGTVMFRLIAGALPFGDDLRSRLRHALDAPPRLGDSAAGVPPELAAVVDRCLALDPHRRPTSRELAETLAGLRRALDTPAPETLLDVLGRCAAEGVHVGASA
jgi:serine/threonine-protein kinase